MNGQESKINLENLSIDLELPSNNGSDDENNEEDKNTFDKAFRRL